MIYWHQLDRNNVDVIRGLDLVDVALVEVLKPQHLQARPARTTWYQFLVMQGRAYVQPRGGLRPSIPQSTFHS